MGYLFNIDSHFPLKIIRPYKMDFPNETQTSSENVFQIGYSLIHQCVTGLADFVVYSKDGIYWLWSFVKQGVTDIFNSICQLIREYKIYSPEELANINVSKPVPSGVALFMPIFTFPALICIFFIITLIVTYFNRKTLPLFYYFSPIFVTPLVLITIIESLFLIIGSPVDPFTFSSNNINIAIILLILALFLWKITFGNLSLVPRIHHFFIHYIILSTALYFYYHYFLHNIFKSQGFITIPILFQGNSTEINSLAATVIFSVVFVAMLVQRLINKSWGAINSTFREWEMKNYDIYKDIIKKENDILTSSKSK